MAKSKAMVMVIIKQGKNKTIAKCPIVAHKRIVVIVNNQFTNAPNTTQIAAGRAETAHPATTPRSIRPIRGSSKASAPAGKPRTSASKASK